MSENLILSICFDRPMITRSDAVTPMLSVSRIKVSNEGWYETEPRFINPVAILLTRKRTSTRT